MQLIIAPFAIIFHILNIILLFAFNVALTAVVLPYAAIKVTIDLIAAIRRTRR